MIRLVLTAILAALVAMPVAANVLWNDSGGPLVLREGPGLTYLPIATLGAGESVERSACDGAGTWCVVSTDAIYGWIDTRTLSAPSGLAPRDEISVTSLPGRDPVPTPAGVQTSIGPPAALPDASATITVPEPVIVPEWLVPDATPPRILSTTEPMRNVTDGLLNLRAGPGTDAPVIGQLRPGEGGLVDVCTRSGDWCRIAPAGLRPGWVLMRLIGLRRL